MYGIDLTGKHALVMGVANHRSLSWAIADALHQAGASLCLTYASERLRDMVEELAAGRERTLVLECDVTQEAQIDAVVRRLQAEWGSVEMFVHGIAYARKEDLEGQFADTPLEGFRTALEVGAYSLMSTTSRLRPLLEVHGGSVVTLSYLAAERAMPNYNIMGTAKAALEHCVRQLAFELGPRNIRVNAISAGPVSTLAARGVRGFTDMLKKHAERAPLRRNITKEDVGKAGLFLLSDLGSGVTGEVLMVDGGFSTTAW